MSTGGYLAKKAASEIATKVRPRAVNWLLNKWWPFDAKSVVLDFSDIPDVRLNYQRHFYEVSVDFVVRNFSYYELEFISCECRITVESNGFMTLKENPLFILKSGAYSGIRMEKTLTSGEIERAKQLFGSSDIKVANFDFRIVVNTRLGIRYLNPSKHLCLRLFEDK